jgi:23S rRNA-/tRNA-specific pseudouridylate synthase
VAKNEIDGPFAVINADDFYGRDSYKVLAEYFNNPKSQNRYALVGYELEKTLSDHGTVNRGVCGTHDDNTLDTIIETLKIGYDGERRIFYNDESGEKSYLKADTPVSMNMWAFYPDYFDYCGASFTEFLNERGQELKSEFFIPLLIDELIASGEKKVDVLSCSEEWFGVTYQDDKPFVIEKLSQLIANGVYPENLWSK